MNLRTSPASHSSGLPVRDCVAGTDLQAPEPGRELKWRVSLVCAGIYDPWLLIMNEHAAGVDPTLSAALWEYPREINGYGSAVLVTAHNMDGKVRCDRVRFMHNSRPVMEGTPPEII